MIDSPQSRAETALLHAEQCLDRRDLDQALQNFYAAEEQGASPDRCSAGRWMIWMLRGDFASAWRESEAIRRRGAHDPHRFWNGEDIRGKRVVVRCLHGFGDAVQFLRYAPMLQSLPREVIFEVPPRFVDLAKCFEGVEQVVTWGDAAPHTPPSWDVQMEVMEFPCFFRTELRHLPVAERYLRLPPAAIAVVAEQMGHSNAMRVGLVWSAGEWNPSRSVPFQALTPLLESPDCDFWNLQGAQPPVEQTPCIPRLLRQIPGCRDSILTLAAVISQLDLVITVDTLAAHLAGALGVPAWVMLQYAADWRWMTGTSRSPWYPSLRLFRQPRPGDWDSVVTDVQRALNTRALPSTARLAS